MDEMKILLDFLNMPLGSSEEVFNRFAGIPQATRRGSGLEQFLFVKGSRSNRVLLVAHADTFWDDQYGAKEEEPKMIVQENGSIRNKNGGLGADDRAGCAIVWLLKDLGHSLLITNGEERGGRGSRWLMNEHPDIADEINSNHQFVIQLDRRGGKDFKCYSVGTDDFRAYVKEQTHYSEPDRSSYTDIVTLCRNITGVNLSIGYGNEHTSSEHLVLTDWKATLEICRTWLKQRELPRFVRKHVAD